jgi:hypothetical protein
VTSDLVRSLTGRWGLLPVALPLTSVVVSRLGTVVFAGAPPIERLLGGATCAVAAFVAGVWLLGTVHALTPWLMLGSLAALACGLARVGPRGRPLPWARAFTVTTIPFFASAALALGLALLAAFWMPVWQWDALGYHLPYVDFALQAGALDGVPPDVPYLSTYPHDVELCFLAFRAMLPDDRLVELAHVPLGLFGALATTALAWRWGAGRAAPAAGAAWLTLPAVFLQLPTNYVDVACAAFLLAASYWTLAAPTPRAIVCAGLALGLYLGSKPNAPIGTALLFALLAWRAGRAGRFAWVGVAALLVVAMGGGSYLENLARHHNPIWPVRVALDGWVLPGRKSMHTLLEAGANAPRAHGPLLARLLVSWTSLTAPPACDMRVGGFGPLVPVVLALAVARVVRERGWHLAVVAAAAVASPDPAVARYVLALPALALALAARSLFDLGPRSRAFAVAAASGAAAWNVAYATPGLAGEGPPLLAYAHMTEAERLRAVGADGPPGAIVDARERLRPGEAVAYDDGFDLPHLAFAPDLSRRVVRIADDADDASLARAIDRDAVRLLLVADDGVAGRVARTIAAPFGVLFALEPCKSTRCAAYFRP